MSDIPEPKISPAFTLEDIRKIRDWDYERYKGMTPQEICEDTRKGAESFLALMASKIDPAIKIDKIRRDLDTLAGFENAPKTTENLLVVLGVYAKHIRYLLDERSRLEAEKLAPGT